MKLTAIDPSHLLSTAMEQSKESIVITDADLDLPGPRIVYVNAAYTQMTGYTSAESLGATPRRLQGPRTDRSVLRRLRQNLERGEVFEGETINYRKDGTEFDLEWQIAPLRDPSGKITHFMATQHDITVRKRESAQLESRLETLQRELVESSRSAGRAEMATGVLHNVGNVLNSVNISVDLLSANAKKSKLVHLGGLLASIAAHAADLGAYLTCDPAGKQVLSHLGRLEGILMADRRTVLEEVESLRKGVAHIKEIVSTQQSHAKVSGVPETLQLADLVQDTLRMSAGSLACHELQVVRDFAEVPSITVEKHKVLLILINLVRNAKHSYDDLERPAKNVTLRIFHGDGTVKVSVSDQGVGIPRENLERIFTHGFTTKKNGHGFGLHSCALAARELGGALHVESSGPGEGATFTLELPVTNPA